MEHRRGPHDLVGASGVGEPGRPRLEVDAQPIRSRVEHVPIVVDVGVGGIVRPRAKPGAAPDLRHPVDLLPDACDIPLQLVEAGQDVPLSLSQRGQLIAELADELPQVCELLRRYAGRPYRARLTGRSLLSARPLRSHSGNDLPERTVQSDRELVPREGALPSEEAVRIAHHNPLLAQALHGLVGPVVLWCVRKRRVPGRLREHRSDEGHTEGDA